MNNQQSTNYLWEINPKKKKQKHPSNLNHPLVCACFTRGNVFAHGEVDTKDLKEVELSDVPKGRLSLRCFYESVGMPKGGVEGCLGLGAVGCVVHVGCWLMVDGWVPKRVSFFWKHVISWGLQSS